MKNKRNMDDEIYQGKFFEFGEGDETILVCPACPQDRKYLRQGSVVFVKNGFGDIDRIEFENWVCKKHGSVRPEWYWKGDFV
jgi:hypothetical protein